MGTYPDSVGTRERTSCLHVSEVADTTVLLKYSSFLHRRQSGLGGVPGRKEVDSPLGCGPWEVTTPFWASVPSSEKMGEGQDYTTSQVPLDLVMAKGWIPRTFTSSW